MAYDLPGFGGTQDDSRITVRLRARNDLGVETMLGDIASFTFSKGHEEAVMRIRKAALETCQDPSGKRLVVRVQMDADPANDVSRNWNLVHFTARAATLAFWPAFGDAEKKMWTSPSCEEALRAFPDAEARLRQELKRNDCAPSRMTGLAVLGRKDPLPENASDGMPLGSDVEVSRLTADLPPDANVYGCGEHTGPLDRRGTHFTHWNTDAYSGPHGGWAPEADPLYASIPFCTVLASGASLGLFFDETRRTVFDFGASLAVETHGNPVIHLLPGRTLAEPAAAWRALVGAAAMPPRWAFGFHQSRWGYDSADDVLAVAAAFREHDLPGEVMWLDIQHMDGFRTFTADPVRFPDLSAMDAALQALGFRTVAIADPGLKVDPDWPLYRDARDRGLFLRNADGSDFVGHVWAGPSSFPDFSLEEARAFWAERIADLVARGIDGIWLDVNEPTLFPEGGAGSTVPNGVLVRGSDLAPTMAAFHNVYGMMEAQATADGLRAAAPDKRPLIVGRAAYAGIERVAGLWTGDVPSTWDALRQTLPMLLNLGVSGVPFVGSDVGGYSGHVTPELYARWLQLGVLSPFFRAHVTHEVPGQEPWQFGIEVTDISRAWLQERYRLVPYLEALALDAARTGAPPLRPLAWEFPGEPGLRQVEDEGLLGPFLLAAPMLEAGATHRTVRLPAGRWVELQSGAVHAGGGAPLDQSVTLAALPLYLREGALLPRAAQAAHTTAELPEALTLDVVPGLAATYIAVLRDGGDGPLEPDGSAPTVTFTQFMEGDLLHLSAIAVWGVTVPPVEIRVRLLDAAPSAARLASGPEVPFVLDAPDRTAIVMMPAGNGFVLDLTLDAPLPGDPATVPVEAVVDVPPGTPAAPDVTVAGGFNGWVHQPLAWEVPGVRARGTIEVPRGQWFEYKLARGSWETVEKWPDCQEASNRYAFGAAHPARHDQVWAWRDLCE